MKKLAARNAQCVMSAEWSFNHNDWVIDSSDGVKRTFGSTVALSADPTESGLTGAVAATVVFDAIPMPPGAVLVGGEVIVETAYAGSTAATLTLGFSGGDVNKLTNDTTIDLKTAGRTALTLDNGLGANTGADIRATVAYTVANATAGKVRIRVEFVIDGRANENLGA